MHKKLEREAAYLAGKPMRIRWWIMLLYMLPLLVLVGFVFGNFVIRGISDGGLRLLIRREAIPIIGFACFPALFAAMRMSQMVVIKENGLFVRDYLGRTYNISYFAIISYKICGYPEGIAICTYGKEHYFRSDLAGYIYLRDEIKRKVGADKEVKEEY